MAVLSRRFLESRMWGHMSTTDLPGSSLLAGRYRLVERLGAGGMSVVWRGFDEVLGRQVAVKVLPPSTSADPSFRRRLRAEAQAAARLSHPHITNVYDYGEATTVDGEPVPYVVMELVDGESLAAVLARVRRLSWPAAVRICAEVSAALAAAHSRGIVHRDVTPANVMLTTAGAKVVDFGISALIGENDIDPDGSLLGTPAYLAPERLEGGQVSPATDVYAVGLLIYRTLIGQLPWDVGTTTALLRAHQYTEPEPLPPVDGLPSAVAALIARCLQKRPDDRPSSAELAHVLAGASAGAPAAARGYAQEWAADAGEDTTILPSQHPFTDGIGRVRPGHAKVADVSPAHAGRGVAAVRGGALDAVGAAAAAAALAHDAPISPAPGSAIPVPVPVAEVEAAVDGAPEAGFGVAPPRIRAVSAPPAGSMAEESNPVPPPPMPAGPGRNAGPGARNSRFGGASRPPAAAAASARPDNAGLIRAPHGPDGNAPGEPRQAAGGGAKPPNTIRPAAPGKAGPPVRRILAGAGLVVLFGGAVYAWSLSIAHNDQTPKASGPTVVAAEGNCVVSYAVWSDDGSRFKAQVTVANRDAASIPDWKLWFLMNGDQVVSGKVGSGQNVPVSYSNVKLTQAGKAVTVTSGGTLSSQQAETLRIEGTYDQSNAAPLAFKLDDKTCETFVSGKPGEPSRQVEHLSNGTTRLGPVPSSKTPVPGITIGDNGIAQVKPTIKPTNGPAAGQSTGPGAGIDDPHAGESDEAPSPPPVDTEASSEPVVEPSSERPSPPPFTTDDPEDPADAGNISGE
jgi:eukaryotic-like serine/threonine-protein kinase